MRTPVDRRVLRRRVRYRIRRTLSGGPDRPRLAVFRSNRQIYVQAIDDETGRTVAQASSMEADLRGQMTKGGSDIEAAKAVGTAVGERLKKAGIEQVVFDRGGYRYHGRVRALAEATRSAGIKF